MTNSSTAFSERYQAQVEAERQYMQQQLREENGKEASPQAPVPTLEEAYRSVCAENRRKPLHLSKPAA